MPDLLRCLKNWSISCSPGVIQNPKAGRTEALVQTKIGPRMSRALDYAAILPTLSAKFITTAMIDARCNNIAELADKIDSSDEKRKEGARVTNFSQLEERDCMWLSTMIVAGHHVSEDTFLPDYQPTTG